jgi:glucosamine--fructose-6-phosphate aminotransferase (isomerizing)
MWAKNWFEKLAKIPTIVSYGSEATYHLHDAETANIFISQSGETKDIIHSFLATTSDNNYLITNSINSYLENAIFQTIDIGAGPEYGVAATKTFTMTCFTLWEMAWRWADKKSRGVVDVDNAAEGLVAGINHVLDCEEVIRTLAKMIARYDNVLFLGRYCDYPIALEGALKLKEVSYIHAEGMPAAEMKHGPIALVDEKTPSVFVVNTDLHLDSIISNMREIKSRGGKIFAISDAVTHDRVAEVADWSFRCHNMCSLAMRPLASNVVLQLLAYHVAVEKGLNPDRPRNLAKSVTV